MKKTITLSALCAFLIAFTYGQQRKGGYNSTNDRMVADINGVFTASDLGGEWNNYYSHHKDGNSVGYEILAGINGAGIISPGIGVGFTNFDQNNKNTLSANDHYLHAGLIVGIDALYGNTFTKTVGTHGLQQPQSRWQVKPAGTFTLSYISSLNDDDNKKGSVQVNCITHYSTLSGFTARIEAAYNINNWFSPGVMYSLDGGIAPMLGFDVSNSFRIKMGYSFSGQVNVGMLFDECF